MMDEIEHLFTDPRCHAIV